MHEILKHLRGDELLLDLGASRGSFDPSVCPATTIQLDLDTAAGGRAGAFVQADAAAMPFQAETFAAVICGHSLEHFERLDEALSEIGRVLTKTGSLFVSVPDASALTDRIFRWMAGPEGGQVNQFSSPQELAALVAKKTGLQHVATRTICTSLSFMNRRNLK